jgi:hypothetical protein
VPTIRIGFECVSTIWGPTLIMMMMIMMMQFLVVADQDHLEASENSVHDYANGAGGLGRDDKRVETHFWMMILMMTMETLLPEETGWQPHKYMMPTTTMRLGSDKEPSKPWRRRDPKPDWFCPISVDLVEEYLEKDWRDRYGAKEDMEEAVAVEILVGWYV